MVGHGSEIRDEACTINNDKGIIKTKSSDYDFRQLQKTANILRSKTDKKVMLA